jgi:hypothetical protein
MLAMDRLQAANSHRRISLTATPLTQLAISFPSPRRMPHDATRPVTDVSGSRLLPEPGHPLAAWGCISSSGPGATRTPGRWCKRAKQLTTPSNTLKPIASSSKRCRLTKQAGDDTAQAQALGLQSLVLQKLGRWEDAQTAIDQGLTLLAASQTHLSAFGHRC